MPPSAPAVLFAAALMLAPAAGPALTGRWSLKLDPGFNDSAVTVQCDITQEGPQLTLECGDFDAAVGTISDATVTFVIMTGHNALLPARFSGTVDTNATVISGTWRLEDTTGNRIGRFRAERQ